MVMFLKDVFFLKTLILKKNQQTTKHDKLLIMQRVNEFIEKQHILFHLAIEKYMLFNEGRCYFRAKSLLFVYFSFGTF